MVLSLFVCNVTTLNVNYLGLVLGGLISSMGCPYTLVGVHILKCVSIKRGLTVCQTGHFAVPENKGMAGKPYFNAIYHA